MNLRQQSHNLGFQFGVHLDNSCSSRLRLWLAKMFLSEQKLSAQIGSLDMVRVGYSYAALHAYVEHSEVLQQLATNSTTANHE
jgi:hypothetical protein